MTDNIDLNALKDVASKQPEETTEQKTERLNREIAELEQILQGPSRYERFMELSAEAKETELARANNTLPPDEKYTNVDEYAESLRTVGPNVNKIRLAAKKAELRELEGK